MKIKRSACHERATKKQSESPTRFEPITSQSPGGRSIHLSYGSLRRTHVERGDVLGSYLTRLLHTARISNVDVALCGERMKDGNFFGSVKEMCTQNRRCESSLRIVPCNITLTFLSKFVQRQRREHSYGSLRIFLWISSADSIFLRES